MGVVAVVSAAATLVGFRLTASHDGTAIRTVPITIHHSSFSVSRLSFPAGTTVRFVVTNTDPIDHEFIVGDRAVQHHIEVTEHPEHDGSVPGQISIPAGTTRTSTYTFGAPGSGLLFGCHLPGHFAYGMRGPIVVTR
jgi:uncharacterized cupredoxin-like copper-binding protein